MSTGDRAGLVRVSPPVEDLAFESFLVTHARTRGLARVRFVADAVVARLE